MLYIAILSSSAKVKNIPKIKTEKSNVNLNILVVTLFILFLLFKALSLEYSGISSPANTFIKRQGNHTNCITMPVIIPYCDNATSQDIPDFSSLIGIIICFKVERPDLIYDVIATGHDIFIISL